jgi:hypothetical protein
MSDKKYSHSDVIQHYQEQVDKASIEWPKFELLRERMLQILSRNRDMSLERAYFRAVAQYVLDGDL